MYSVALHESTASKMARIELETSSEWTNVGAFGRHEQ